MGARQSRHRPRNNTQLSTGTLSRARTRTSQAGQCEGGATTLSPRGTRQTTTLRKEPTARPTTASPRSKNSIALLLTVREQSRLPGGGPVVRSQVVRRRLITEPRVVDVVARGVAVARPLAHGA